MHRSPFPESKAGDEASLVARAQIDPAAFAELYQRHLGRIYAYLRAHTGSEDDAADLAQQVFLQAFDALPKYRQRGLPFSSWLFQIAHNILTDTYRRRRNVISWEAIPQGSHLSLEGDPEIGILHTESIEQLRHYLARLDPAKRELLALRFAAGLSAPQIATIVGRSPEAVKKELTRILHKLKECYHER